MHDSDTPYWASITRLEQKFSPRVSKPSVIKTRPMFQLGPASVRETDWRKGSSCHRLTGHRRRAPCPGCAERFAAGRSPLVAVGMHSARARHPSFAKSGRSILTVLRKGVKVPRPTQNSWLPPLASVRLSLLPFTFAAPSRVCWLLLVAIDHSLPLAPVLHSLDCKPVRNSTLLMTSSSTHSVQRLVALALEQYMMSPLSATRFASFFTSSIIA